MKHLIVFSLIMVTVAYGIPPELEAVIKAYTLHIGRDCKKELDASDDDVAPIMVHSLPTTENGKCFLACMHKKAGFLDASGKINKAGILSCIEQIRPFDKDYYIKFKQVMEVCLESTKDEENECATAYSMYECVLTEQAKVGLPNIDFTD